MPSPRRRVIDDDEQARLYKESMGEKALERQQELAKSRCSECFVVDGHHPTCKRGQRLARAAERRAEEQSRR